VIKPIPKTAGKVALQHCRANGALLALMQLRTSVPLHYPDGFKATIGSASLAG
jgi:hypothetical protein